ncbi:MAG: helix-turn-helix domain-containing protein [Nocardioides sp.]|uniref:PucR family transcriptional regulator n=1 Tax=Nocardioides sp. TaxID=35761 RepID=UPI0039E4E0F3
MTGGARTGRTTWRRLVEELGDVVVSHALAHPDAVVERVAIHADHHVGGDDERAGQALCLAIGMSAEQAMASHADRRTGVAVKAAAAGPLQAIAMREGTTLIAVDPAADWIEVVGRVSGLLTGSPTAPGGSDAYAVAAAAADIVGGPVTIEDLEGRVLAYAGDHQLADEARIASILGRRVPDQVTESLRAAGVMRLISSAEQAIALPPVDGLARRAVAPIRAGGNLVGAAWAIVPGPPDEATLRAYAACVRLAAGTLTSVGRAPTIRSAIENDALAALLYGGAGAPAAARRLRMEEALVEVGIVTVEADDLSTAVDTRNRLLARLVAVGDRYLGRLFVTEFNGTIYLLGSPSEGGTAPMGAWLSPLLTSPGPVRLYAGIGRPCPSGEVPRGRQEAELALAVATADGGGVRRYAEVWTRSFLQRLQGLPMAAELAASGAVPALARHDQANHTDLVGTLEAHYRAGADVRAAAESLHVHPNTFRQRMRRIHELTGLDPSAPTDIDTLAITVVQLALLRRDP